MHPTLLPQQDIARVQSPCSYFLPSCRNSGALSSANTAAIVFPPGQQLSRNIYRKHLGINEHDSISVSKHCFLVAKEIQPERTTMGSSIIVIIFDSACFLLSPLNEAPEGC